MKRLSGTGISGGKSVQGSLPVAFASPLMKKKVVVSRVYISVTDNLVGHSGGAPDKGMAFGAGDDQRGRFDPIQIAGRHRRQGAIFEA